MPIPRCLQAALLTCVTAAVVSGQSVPGRYLDGVVLDEPLPTQFTTGETYWVAGSLTNEGIPALTFEFASERGVLEHRALVVNGRFEHPLVFKHSDAGEHAFRITFFPSDRPAFSTEPFVGIEILEGEGEIDRPWAYYDGFIDNAYFRPNAMRADALEYPPMFITTGGRVDRVVALVSDGHGGRLARELSDDGMAGDLKAGDGVFTMAAEPYHPPDFEVSPFGSVTVDIIYEEVGGEAYHFTAECGLVDGEAAKVQKLSDDAYQADHVVNLVDDGTLFELLPPFVDLRVTARRFYQYFADEYDFLVVRSALPLSNGAHGFNIHVRNDISGIGIRPFDDSAEFGSAGRLQSATFINFRLLGPLIHELAHNWANFLRPFGGPFWGGHWGLSDVQGVLGGRAVFINALGDGEYAIPGNSASSSWGGRYSMLELYLMGLVPPEEVPAHQVLVAPRILRFDELRGLIVAADQLATVTIGDVIDAHGPRLPSHAEAPKSYRMATVVVSDRPLTPLELTYHDRQAEWFGSDRDSDHAFAAATGDRATVDTRLPPAITAVLDDAIAIVTTDGLPGSNSELEQNYPNPFNGSTTWRYTLRSAATAALEIYAANGQRVRTMPQGRREAGRHTISWDGTDDDDHALATGVYLARLRAGESVVTRKLTLVR